MKYLLPLLIVGSLAVTNHASAQTFYSAPYGDGLTTPNVYEISGGVETAYATDPNLQDARGIALDPSGNVYVAIGAAGNNSGDIEEIAAGTGTITTVSTGLLAPTSLAYYNGSLYTNDSGVIYQITLPGSGGSPSTYSYAWPGAGGNTYTGLAFGSSGQLYNSGFTRSNYVGGQVAEVVPGGGTGDPSDYSTVLASGLGGGVGNAWATGLAIGPDGNLYVSVGTDAYGGSNKAVIDKINLATNVVTTFATLPKDSGQQYANAPLALAWDGNQLDVASANTAASQIDVFSSTGTLVSETTTSAIAGGIAIESAAVPEPSTWALMFAGFIGLSVQVWRRKAVR